MSIIVSLRQIARSLWTMAALLPLLLLFSSAVHSFYSVEENSNNNGEVTGILDKYYYYTICDYNGQKFPAGYFSPEPCIDCECNATTGKVTCSVRACRPQQPLTTDTDTDTDTFVNPTSLTPAAAVNNKPSPVERNCIRFDPSPPGDKTCCPRCVERGCRYKNRLYPAGAKIEAGPCEKCYCPWAGGDPETGAPICQPIKCAGIRCVDSVVPKNKCCPICPHGKHNSQMVYNSYKTLP